MRTQKWRPKSSVKPKNHRIWNMNPSYIWGLTGCFQDMHSTSHSQSRFLKSVNGRTGSTQTRKGTWSTSTQAGPRPIKVLLLECIDGSPDVGTASLLGSTPRYSRLKYMPKNLQNGEYRKELHREEHLRGLFKKYPDWNCSGCSLVGMCLQPVLTCLYMS